MQLNISGIGSENTFSYGDWLNLTNQLKAKAIFVTGIASNTDFMKDVQTFKTFTEYIAGDSSTKGGAIRASEGVIRICSRKVKECL